MGLPEPGVAVNELDLLDDDDARPQLAEMCLLFIRTLLQTTYYTPEHPAHSEGVAQTFRMLRRVQRMSRHIVFVVGSQHDAQDVQVAGALAEPVSLRALLRTSMGSHFVERFIEYFQRNGIVSFAISPEVTEDELDRFLVCAVEHRIEPGGDAMQDGRPPMTEALEAKGITHVRVMVRDELIGGERRIPWAAKVALSRMRKDLRLVPLYTDATGERLRQAKAMLVRDIVRPLVRPEALRDVLLNADIVVSALPEDQVFDLERAITDALKPDVAARIGQLLVSELDQFAQDGGDARGGEWAVGVGPARRDRVLFALGRIAARFAEEQDLDDCGLLEGLFDRGVIGAQALPPHLRNRVVVRRWTEQFLESPDTHIERLDALEELGAFEELVRALALVCRELIARREQDAFFRLTSAFERIRKACARQRPERVTVLDRALTPLCDKSHLGPLLEVARDPLSDDREAAQRSLAALGPGAVPFLLALLYDATEPEQRRDLCRMIARSREAAGEHLLMEVETFRHKWTFVEPVIRLLGDIGYRPAARAVRQHLDHIHPRVREAAVASMIKLAGAKAVPLILERLEDEDDDRVVAGALDALRILGCQDPLLLHRILEVIQDDQIETRDDQLAASALMSVRSLGNFRLPPPLDGTIEDALLGRIEPRTTLFGMVRRKQPLPAPLLAAFCETAAAIGTGRAAEALERVVQSIDAGERKRVAGAAESLRARLQGAESG
jgi:HEAT repeat protein